jgi:hypothetical protein
MWSRGVEIGSRGVEKRHRGRMREHGGFGEGALTAYEQERKARIESNQRLFQSLGLDAAAEAASARRSRPPRKRSRASGEGMDDDGERRRSAR